MDVRNKTAFLWLSRTLALKCSNFKKNVHIHYYLIYILKNVKRLRKSAFLRFFSVTENHCGCQPIINCASKTPLNKVLFMSNLRSCCCKKVSSIHVINSKGGGMKAAPLLPYFSIIWPDSFFIPQFQKL